MSRKYSVDEIERMRRAARCLVEEWIYDRDAATEDRLRTYMLNGTAPDELEAAASAWWEAEFERREAATMTLDAFGRAV